MFSAYRRVMLGEVNNKTNTFSDLDTMDKWVLIPIVILIFVFGVYPQLITNLTEQSVSDIILQYQTKINGTIIK